MNKTEWSTGSGIGRACAILLAREGASGVVVGDIAIDAAKAVVEECRLAATNSQFFSEAIRVDVTQEDSVRQAFDHTVQAVGYLDYCVNCAGVGGPLLTASSDS